MDWSVLSQLGETQWDWLEKQLSIPAGLRIIASSSQFGIIFNGYEAWANFPHEQKRFLDLIKKTHANGWYLFRVMCIMLRLSGHLLMN